MRAGAKCFIFKLIFFLWLFWIIHVWGSWKWQRTAKENTAGIRRIRYSLILRLVALYCEVFFFLFSIEVSEQFVSGLFTQLCGLIGNAKLFTVTRAKPGMQKYLRTVLLHCL